MEVEWEVEMMAGGSKEVEDSVLDSVEGNLEEVDSEEDSKGEVDLEEESMEVEGKEAVVVVA